MGGAGIFFLLLFIILLIYGAWVGWKIYNARKHGEKLVGWQSYVPFMKPPSSSTNYPAPRSAGPLEWVKGKIAGLSNKRSQQGGYEESRLEGGQGQYQGINSARRGRGLEDDTWDSRVGRDDDPYGPGPGGYHEEQELGLSTPGYGHVRNESGPYGAGDYMSQSTGYGGGSGAGDRSRSTDRGLAADPFSDAHQAPSLRSVSPRPEPIDTYKGHSRNNTLGEDGNTSPLSTRKSAFREDVN